MRAKVSEKLQANLPAGSYRLRDNVCKKSLINLECNFGDQIKLGFNFVDPIFLL